AVAVRRDDAERGNARPRDDLHHHLCGESREAAQAALLPGRDESAHRAVVRDRRPRGCESEPPPGALAAPANRPGGRRAAALAEGRTEPRQPVDAGRADDRPTAPAAETALREQEVEHTPTLAAGRRAVCAGFAPTSPHLRAPVRLDELLVIADVEPLAVEAIPVDGLALLEPGHEPT